MKKLLLAISLIFYAVCCFATDNKNIETSTPSTKQTISINPQSQNITISAQGEEKLWSILFYRGTTSGQSFWEVVTFHYSGINETMYSLEIAYTLSKDNAVNKYIMPYATFQVAANIGERFNGNENDSTAEGDIYLVLRWLKFPWNKYVTTTAAIGDGLSYTSDILLGEEEDPGLTSGTNPDDLQKLLNFFLLEVTFALPKYPEFQFVTRLHHRCTLFGLIADTNQGSTNVGIGIRYYF